MAGTSSLKRFRATLTARRLGRSRQKKPVMKRISYIHPSHFSARLSSAFCRPFGKCAQGANQAKSICQGRFEVAPWARRASATRHTISQTRQVISQEHPIKTALAVKVVD